MLSINITGSYTDLYEITMGEVHFLTGRQDYPASFDYFFRKNPFAGGYTLFAGLDDLLTILEDLHFSEDDIDFLRTLNFNPQYLEYLRTFRFRGNIYSVQEGEVVFPDSPVLRVAGTLFETQLIETLLLNTINFESLIATKASRIREVAGHKLLSDFGLRRAQGPGGILAARAALIGGFDSTSNVYAASFYHIEAAGTMAHAFIQSYDSEIEAFRAYADKRPENAVFLVDTYDTIKSGIPNAITVALEMEKAGHKAAGIRLDSGDLAWLAKTARKMLDQNGLQYMKIIASNQLDEMVIKSLEEQGAPVDAFGVGTRLVTGQPDGALDGVYKLAMLSGKPRLKLSETMQKITLPGVKNVTRVLDTHGQFLGFDAIFLDDEEYPGTIFHPHDPAKFTELKAYKQEPLLTQVMAGGTRVFQALALKEISAYAKDRLNLLPAEYKRFENPHEYKVGISRNLMGLRDKLCKEHKAK